jgi:hypothetical protein
VRLLILLLLSVTLRGIAGTDCHVSCPTGSHGGCVKFDEKCYCSCRVNADNRNEELLNFLKSSEASRELIQQVKEYLYSNEQSARKVFTDPKTKKEFIVFLKKGTSD